MKVARTKAELRDALAGRRPGSTVGFVPTMGALHEGHLSLVRAARGSSDVVVVSIFVNPLQFAPHEDYSAYPRDERHDIAVLKREAVDVVFIPTVEEMYPRGSSLTVRAGRLGDVLEGESRPGHFDGVCTVVTKLFNLVQPDVAFFGQKDAQQVAVIKRMVDELFLDVRIVVCPTVRERDGLALSSRNAYLTPEERARATALFKALQAGEQIIDAGGDADEAEKTMWEALANDPDVDLDYAAAVDPESFGPAAREGPILLAVAARIGKTRLIDNVVVTPPER